MGKEELEQNRAGAKCSERKPLDDIKKGFARNGGMAAGILRAFAGSDRGAYLVCKAFIKFAENSMDGKLRRELKAEAAVVAAELAEHIWPGMAINAENDLERMSPDSEDRLLAAGKFFVGFLQLAYPAIEPMYLTAKMIEHALEHTENVRVEKGDLTIVRRLARSIWPGDPIAGMAFSPQNADYSIQFGTVPSEEENVMFR